MFYFPRNQFVANFMGFFYSICFSFLSNSRVNQILMFLHKFSVFVGIIEGFMYKNQSIICFRKTPAAPKIFVFKSIQNLIHCEMQLSTHQVNMNFAYSVVFNIQSVKYRQVGPVHVINGFLVKNDEFLFFQNFSTIIIKDLSALFLSPICDRRRSSLRLQLSGFWEIQKYAPCAGAASGPP